MTKNEAAVTLSARPQLQGALTACFDAVAAPEQWPEAMETLAGAFGALGACFNLRESSRSSRTNIPTSRRYRDMLTEFYQDGWAEHDMRAKFGWPLIRDGGLMVVEQAITTPETRAAIPIYRDLFRHHDLDLFAAIALKVDGRMMSFNIVRSERLGVFEGEELEQLKLARPYLNRLLDFSGRMADMAAMGALTAFEYGETPAVLLDDQGRVRDCNALARALLGEDLALRGGRLTSRDPGSNARLEALVSAARLRDATQASPELSPIPLYRQSLAPLIIEAVPLRGALADAFRPAGVLLLINDLARSAVQDATLLARLYGLTPREAEVADRLGRGDGVDDIAEDLDLRRSSVRQIVKTVLAKTDTGRQGQLVALLSRLPGRASTKP